MPTQQMRSESLPNRTDVRWFHTEAVDNATSDPLIIPSLDRDSVAVMVAPGSSARVEYTLSGYADIDAGTATWLPWDEGDITAPASSVVSSRVAAVRLVSTGSSEWWVNA